MRPAHLPHFIRWLSKHGTKYSITDQHAVFGNEQDNSTNLFALASAHDWWLCTLVVNISPNVLVSRHRRGLRLLNGLVYGLLGGLVNTLKGSVRLLNTPRKDMDDKSLLAFSSASDATPHSSM
jgi:hypothetical protein